MHTMENDRIVSEMAKELGLNFTENNINTMSMLLELGMPPENLILLLGDIRAEITRLNPESAQ